MSTSENRALIRSTSSQFDRSSLHNQSIPSSTDRVQLRDPAARPRMIARPAVQSQRLSGNVSVVRTGSGNTSQRCSRKIQPPSPPPPPPSTLSSVNQHCSDIDNLEETDGRRPLPASVVLTMPDSDFTSTCSYSLTPETISTPLASDQTNLLIIDKKLIRQHKSSNRWSLSSPYQTDQRSSHFNPYPKESIIPEDDSDQEKNRRRNPLLSEQDGSENLPVSLEGILKPENGHLKSVKVRVELVLIFLKIGQVDTVNERYQADVFLQSRWREPLLDARRNEAVIRESRRKHGPVENPLTDLTPRRHLHTLKLQDDEFWNPLILLDNAQGEPIEIVSYEVEFVEPDFEAYLVEKRRIKGIFHETLELRHFPFDCQDLSVTVTSDRTVNEVEFVPSPTELSQVDGRCAADCQEWKIFRHVDVHPDEIQTVYSPGSAKSRHPALVFTSRSARRSGYFMMNQVLISCVLSLLAFSIFAVPVDGNRMQLSLLLLLTTVTFKFAASQNLPKISYLTYLDKMVLANFFMLVLLCVWHAVARVVSKSYPALLDNEQYVFYTMLSCYTLGALLFILIVFLDAGARRRLMNTKEIAFAHRKERMERDKQGRSVVTVGLEEWLNSPTNQTVE